MSLYLEIYLTDVEQINYYVIRLHCVQLVITMVTWVRLIIDSMEVSMTN